jgi:hypothetical protein
MVLMPKGLHRAIACGLLLSLSVPAYSQEDADDETGTESPVETEEVEADSEEEFDPELDEQGFDPTADDDFVPSEDIPADAPIDFPTDI